VLAEATRAIEGQAVNLDNLRSRVGILLSAATIATSFLGGTALSDGKVDVLGQAAIALFVIHVFVGLWILVPRHWTFQMNGSTMMESWIATDDVSEDRLRQRLIHWLSEHYERNERLLEPLWRLYAWAIGLLGLEIAAWLAELAGLKPG
jgi:hypothetical protein